MSQPANDDYSQHLSDDEASYHEEASDSGTATNKPKQQQQQQLTPTTTTISNIKLLILRAMEMEHYLEYINNDVWKVIQNGNSKKRISTVKDGVVRILPPVSAAEIHAVEKEKKDRTILLMAIPKEHLRRFHGMDDAKEIWEAIRTRFGGNANSKKMQKALTFQANEIYAKDEKLKRYRRIGMKAVKEKEQLKKTVDSWKDSSKNLWKLIDSGIEFLLGKLLREIGALLLRPQQDHPLKNMKDRDIFDSECSGHMTGNKNLDRKSTTGGCQFLRSRLISWQCKKQTIVATSTTEAEYVAAASCCGQVLWIQNQMLDYGFNFMNTKIHIDNESTICIVKNPVYHSKTKHIEIRHHFIRDSYEKKLIRVEKIHTDFNVADLLTKAFDGPRFNFLVVNIGYTWIARRIGAWIKVELKLCKS
ncbi:hypothetical protein Tco_1284305 [Tanacetum coccineum]